MMFFIWFIGAIVIGITLLYIIGRNIDPKDRDLGHMIFMALLVTVAWHLLVSIALVAAPFYLPYYLGKRNRKKALEKSEMWDTLKK